MKLAGRTLSRRRLIAAVGMFGLGAAAVACGAPPAPTAVPAKPADAAKPAEAVKPAEAPKPAAAAASSAAPGSIKVVMTNAAGGISEKKLWDTLFEAYQKKFPQYKMEMDLSSAEGEYDQKLFAQLAAGTLPDIVRTSDNHVVPFKQNKISRDMIPYAQKTNFPYQDFDKSFLDLGMVEGELHMLPRGGDVVILYVNKKMVQEAGVDLPWTLDPASNNWSWEDLEKATRRLAVDAKGKRGDEAGFDKQNIAVYGAAIQNNWWAVYVPAVLAAGGEFVSPDLSKSMIDGPQSVKAFEFLTRNVLEGTWAPTSFVTTIGNHPGVWAAGKAAMFAGVRAHIPSIRDKIKDDWDVVHFPKGPAKRVTGMGTFGYALSTASKQPDDAWKFLDWFYGEEGMTILAQNYGSVPAMKRFAKADFWRKLPAPPANNDVFTDAFAYGTLPPRLPFYSTGQFKKTLDDGIIAIELGKKKPEEVVKEVHTEMDNWLKTAKK
jgi:multiple sugar transport system substrate-binding protein